MFDVQDDAGCDLSSPHVSYFGWKWTPALPTMHP